MSSWYVQAAYPFDFDFANDDKLEEAAGRTSDFGGSGASWAGCGFRDVGWSVATFDEANKMHERLSGVYIPDMKVRVCAPRN